MFSAERPSPENASHRGASLQAQRRAPTAPASSRPDGRGAADASHSPERVATGPVSQVLDAGPVDLPSGPERIGSLRHLLWTLDRVRPYFAALAASRLADLPPLADADERATAEPIADSDMDPEDHQETVARAQLRASLTAYVTCLRGDGVPPERMLLLVKSAVAKPLGAALPGSLGVIACWTMMEDAVRWSVEAYYDRP